MKHLILALSLLAALGVSAKHLDVKDETNAEASAAIDQFGKWGDSIANRELILITWRKDGNSPWTARVYDVADKPPILWEESGYPRLMLGVKAVEQDFDRFPKGHVGQYKEQ